MDSNKIWSSNKVTNFDGWETFLFNSVDGWRCKAFWNCWKNTSKEYSDGSAWNDDTTQIILNKDLVWKKWVLSWKKTFLIKWRSIGNDWLMEWKLNMIIDRFISIEDFKWIKNSSWRRFLGISSDEL